MLVAALCLLSWFSVASTIESSPSIPVGGWGDWQYTYEPSFLPVPPEASIEHAHGIVIQEDGTIVITYQDKVDPSKCLLRWNTTSSGSTDYQHMPDFLGPGKTLCAGVPHGLRAAVEMNGKKEETLLYHANNDQALHKTDMNGDMLWTVLGPPMLPNNTNPLGLLPNPDHLLCIWRMATAPQRSTSLTKPMVLTQGNPLEGLGVSTGNFKPAMPSLGIGAGNRWSSVIGRIIDWNTFEWTKMILLSLPIRRQCRFIHCCGVPAIFECDKATVQRLCQPWRGRWEY